MAGQLGMRGRLAVCIYSFGNPYTIDEEQKLHINYSITVDYGLELALHNQMHVRNVEMQTPLTSVVERANNQLIRLNTTSLVWGLLGDAKKYIQLGAKRTISCTRW